MLNFTNIVVAIGVIIFGIIIVAAVRKALRRRSAIKQRLAEISRDDYRRIHPSTAAMWDTHRPRLAEVTSAPLYQRVRSARMNEIVRASDNMQLDSLIQAGIRTGSSPEVAAAYAAEILGIDEDEGEPLPEPMLHRPNIGGEDHPEYRGANFVEPEEIVEEMQAIQHFGNTGRGE